MRTVGWLMSAMVGISAAGSAHAQQNYPIRPIRLIVPYAPGGGADVMARVLTEKLTGLFAVPVIVDNRPGGSGIIGTETAVRANPDGYTMMLISVAHAANAAFHKLPYDPVTDVAPIALIEQAGFLVALHPSLPVRNIEDLIAYARAHPAKLNAGGSTGGIAHLATELFNHMASTTMMQVPYKGGGPALNALISGEIQLVFGAMNSTTPHVRSKRLRGIAVTTPRRSNAVPDIPAVAETLPGYEALTWTAVAGPKGLRKDIVARWNTEINRVLQLTDVRARLAGDGVEPAGGSADRFREVLDRDVAKWQKVVKVAGIKPES
jgi:tripartite-type tricarboxylate transporter receptor subunit TctC